MCITKDRPYAIIFKASPDLVNSNQIGLFRNEHGEIDVKQILQKPDRITKNYNSNI